MELVDLEVVIPAYNEEVRIVRTLERIHEYYSEQAYTWRCTVVSDGSKDRTGEIVTEFGKTHPNFFLLSYEVNRGKGYAVRVGMLKANAKRVLFCDADLATPQEETEKLWRALDEGFEVAIGSRPLKDSNLEKRQPFYREFLGRAFNTVQQMLAVKGIEDTQCGFKMFTRDAAQEVFSRCALDRFSFDIEALVIAKDLGFKIAEVPIRWSHQEGSKVNIFRDGPNMLWDLVKLRLKGKKARLAPVQRPEA